jgi:hypothetical protein
MRDFISFWSTSFRDAFGSAWGLVGGVDLLITILGTFAYDAMKDRGPAWLRSVLHHPALSSKWRLCVVFLAWFMLTMLLVAPFRQFQGERKAKERAQRSHTSESANRITEDGSERLVAGHKLVPIKFESTKSAPPTQVNVWFENTADGEGSVDFPRVVESKTAAGMTIRLLATPQNDHTTLHWSASFPDSRQQEIERLRATVKQLEERAAYDSAREFRPLTTEQVEAWSKALAPFHIKGITVTWSQSVDARRFFYSLRELGKKLNVSVTGNGSGGSEGDEIEIVAPQEVGEELIRLFKSQNYPVTLAKIAHPEEVTEVSIFLPMKF